MLTQYVNSNSFASFIYLDRNLELMPEPYRCQGSKVTFILSIDEYVKYLSDYNFLYENPESIKNLIKMYRPEENQLVSNELFSLFLKDVAYAILKEVYYAEWRDKECTNIVHYATENEMDEDAINLLYEGVGHETRKELMQFMRSKGYSINLPISEKNIKYWKYGVLAYYLSGRSNTSIWSYKINNY